MPDDDKKTCLSASLTKLLIEAGRLIGVGIIIGVITYLQNSGIIDRIKKSENLIQDTVKDESADVSDQLDQVEVQIEEAAVEAAAEADQ